jgi:hypothetical protein
MNTEPESQPRRVCRYCFVALERGDEDSFCSDECANADWRITPTIDGEVLAGITGDRRAV